MPHLQLSVPDGRAKPQGCEQMRQDITAFYKNAHLRLDEADPIRWMWRAL
jgi:hypothetical protein